MQSTDSLEWFLTCIGAEIVVAIPSLLVSAFDKLAGSILCIVITVTVTCLTIYSSRGRIDRLMAVCVPSIFATVCVELTLSGFDSSGIMFLSLIYCCALFIRDIFRAVMRSVSH